jgi:hypothetical protein
MPDPKTSKSIMNRVLTVKPIFAKANNKEGYAYLNSRFRTNVDVKSPMSGNSGGRSSNNQKKSQTDQLLKTYYGGNPTQRSSANKAAKTSSNIHTMLNQKLYTASKTYATNPNKANREFTRAMSKANRMYKSIINKVGTNSVISKNTYKMMNRFSGAFTNPQLKNSPLKTAVLKSVVSYENYNKPKVGSAYDQLLQNRKK